MIQREKDETDETDSFQINNKMNQQIIQIL